MTQSTHRRGPGSVFIVGAGYVGSATAELMRAAGHEVHTGRRTTRAEPFAHALDVLRPATFPAALRAATRIIYCVAAEDGSERAYREAYVEGLANVLGAATEAERVVFVSSTGVYAQADGSVVDEQSPASGASFSARLLLEGESLLSASPRGGTSVRFSGIYGPGRDRLVRLVRAATPVSAASRAVITNRIHRDDCARVLAFLLAQPRVQPLYVGSDEAPTAQGEILDWLAARLGLPPVPVGEDDPALPRRAGSKRVSSARLRAEGFSFTYPTYREGFAALLTASE